MLFVETRDGASPGALRLTPGASVGYWSEGRLLRPLRSPYVQRLGIVGKKHRLASATFSVTLFVVSVSTMFV